MKQVEQVVLAELARLEASPESSVVAALAVNLARRLDAGPAERDAVALSREVRLCLAELRQGKGGNSELEAFLAGIAAPSFRGPGD